MATHAVDRDRDRDIKKLATLDDGRLLDLIDCIYAAAVDADRWSDVAGALGSAFRARFSLVFGFDPATSRVLYTQSSGLPAAALAPYEHTYAALDVRMPAALAAPTGTVVTDESLIDRATYHASAIYNEYLRPHDCDHLMAVLPENSAGTRVIISVNRPRCTGHFEPAEQAFLRRLVPHLQRAVQMSAQLVTAAGAQRLSRELMARAQFGIVSLGRDGHVIEANPTAARLLRDGGCLTQANGRLMATHRAVNDRLQRVLAATAYSVLQRTEGRVDPLVIPGPSGPPLRLLIAPLPRAESITGPLDPLMVAFLFSKAAGPVIAPATLSLIYGLTPAQARIAAKLAQGQSLANIARVTAVSIETVRTHLKSIFAKTGCDSQTALVREILLGPAQSLSRG